MNRERPHHPFQLAIEQCWDEGRTPRILVLGDRPGVVLPQHVLAKHEGTPIAIDLDPTYPLKPGFYAGFMCAELAFAGSVILCTFPWDAILAVQDLELGSGFVRLAAKAATTGREQSVASKKGAEDGPPPVLPPTASEIEREERSNQRERWAAGNVGHPAARELNDAFMLRYCYVNSAPHPAQMTDGQIDSIIEVDDAVPPTRQREPGWKRYLDLLKLERSHRRAKRDVKIGGPGTNTHQPPTTRGEVRGFKPRVIDGGKKED